MIFVSRHYCRLTGLWFLPSYIPYLKYASPFARIGAFSTIPPLGSSPLWLSPPPPLSLFLSPSLSPPPLRSSRPPALSRLLPPHLPSGCYRSSGWWLCHTCLRGFPTHPLSLRYSASAAFTLLPSTCRPWLLLPFPTSPLPCFDLSSPSPSLYPSLLSLFLSGSHLCSPSSS